MAPHGIRRAARWLAAAGAAVTAVALIAVPAGADPASPDDAGDAVAQLAELSREAERLAERWHHAKDQLAARRAELARAEEAAARARAAAETARAAEESFRAPVDEVIRANFRGARLDQFATVFGSASPGEVLERMSAVDLIAEENAEVLDGIAGARERAERAELAASDAATTAAVAELEAARLVDEIARTGRELNGQIAVVRQRLDGLTGSELASYLSEGVTDYPINVAGDGVVATALRAALSRQGAPYVWAATGPDTFDCSGLVQWAYRQAGLLLPRSSREQARVGQPVNPAALRPGDLIALYSPVSHIGIYVGEGRYLNAPQSGDVVKVAPVPWDSVTAIRRVA